MDNENGYPSPTASYEEVAQSSQLFWEKLREFHVSFRTRFMIPTVGGNGLDLHRLFVEVTSRGGFEKVIGDRKWKEVVVVFNFPTTITSASFVLRKYYLSLLYHFEQVYYFHKQLPSLPAADPATRNISTHLGDSTQDRPVNVDFQPGYSVNGTIDGKFDNGYLITVNMGSDQLKGVLYHVPLQTPQSSYFPEARSRRNRKKSRLALRGAGRSKSNRSSGYNYFFSENYGKLKSTYYGQEKAITQKIGILWNNLSEADKQVYEEKGVRDKERYKNEMAEYKTSYNGAELQ